MFPRTVLCVSLASALLCAAASGASAQTTPAPTAPSQPVQPQPRDPNMPAPQNTVPEKIDSTGSTRNLSDKLEATGGVLTPPSNVDPGIAAKPPVPNPGTTTVIPPGSVPQQTK